MIRINKDYVVKVDENNYIACRDMHRQRENKTTGKVTDDYYVVGYFNKLADAVRRIIEDELHREFIDKTVNLKEAVKMIQDAYGQFDSIMASIPSEND